MRRAMKGDSLWTQGLRLMFPVAAPPGIIAISLLGCLCGIVAGLAISALHVLIDLARLAFEHVSIPFASGADQLPALFLAPLLGALLVGLIYQFIKPYFRNSGLVHIVERLMHHQGHLPLQNSLANFFGSVIAIGSGQIVGREGAATHLGAAGGSFIGRYLELPHSTVRALVGCGAAAGIAASFNTPLAGVILTMEVIVMEYSVMGLAPTIIAAVSANAVAHVWLNSHPTLSVSTTELESLRQLPFLLLTGAVLGICAAAYSRSIAWLTRRIRTIPVWICMGVTGLTTGLFAWALPQVGQDGFVSINTALSGDLPLLVSLALGGIVLICSSLAIASAIPGGIIMPCMLAGACLGSALGQLGHFGLGMPSSDVALYALLGLGAMMGAVLQAPLTALIVILELSGRTDMLFAAMLTVITAVLVSRQANGNESIVALLLKNRGLDFRNDPVSQSLRRISVMAAMNRSFSATDEQLSLDQAREILLNRPDWALIRPEAGNAYVISAADIRHAVSAAEAADKPGDSIINLAKIPADRRQCAPVHLRASLQEAWETFEQTGAEALFVERQTQHDQKVTYGILTRKAVEKAYRP